MRIVLTSIFVLISLALAYLLSDSIRRPVDFRETWAARSEAVKTKLTEIAELQKMYKVLKGDTIYAEDFGALEAAFLNDSFYILKIEGDPFDTTIVVDTTQIMYPARDSVISYLAEIGKVDAKELAKFRKPAMEILNNWSDTAADASSDPVVSQYIDFCTKGIKDYIDEVQMIPSTRDKVFSMEIGIVAMEGRRAFGRVIPTFEVRAQVGEYMSEYPVSEYSMYDPSYNHEDILKVGDLYKATTSGNW